MSRAQARGTVPLHPASHSAERKLLPHPLRSRIRRQRALLPMSSRNRANSRSWSISGRLGAALGKAVAEAAGKVRLVKMNIDDHPAIAGQLGIQSIPAVIAFKNGQPVDGFMGAVPESQIREFINRVAGDSGKDEIAEAVAAAAEAREAGDDQTAMQIYSAILQQAPDNVDALAGLADILFEAGQVDRAREILDRTPEAKQDAAPIAAVKAKLTLAEQVAELGGADELESRLAANPKDHQARFDLALIQNAKGMRDEAADNLLAIIKTDRAWQDDAARN